MYDDALKLSISINNFIRSIKDSDFKGSKYTT